MPKQVVVVGAGQGGLSAAIHARLRGFDVLVLEQRAHCGGKAVQLEDRGFRFDLGPSIVILPRIYDDVIRRAGKNPEDYITFDRLDPISRVFSHDVGTLDLPADRGAYASLLSNVAPKDRDPFLKLLDKIDKAAPLIERSIFKHPFLALTDLANKDLARIGMLFNMRRRYKDLIDRTFESPLLKAFFYGFPSYGGQSYQSRTIAPLLIPYYMITDGVYYPRGGIGAIPRAFERLARELGVVFETNTEVQSLSIKNGRVRGVSTSAGHRDAEVVICNIDRLTAGKWLGRKTDLSPSYSYFTISLGLRKRHARLSHHNLFIPRKFVGGFEQLYRDNRFPDPPIVYVNDTTASDSETAPQGMGNVFLVVTCPSLNEDPQNWRELAERTLKEHGVAYDPDDVLVERVQTPRTFEERDGNYRGSLYGPAEENRLWKMFPLRCKDEEIENLFYCGGSVQPGAGLPMVTLSGKFAAELVP